ncbi:MAG: hypothetical protein O9327_18295 [Polaromonas sp.]|nr:hypothetical protein [Polaromonas sp.]
MSKGVASIAGERAFEFASSLDLIKADAIWITNIQQSSFLAEGLDVDPRSCHLRSASFFPTPITALAQEVGAGGPTARQADSGHFVPLLAEIANRVVGFSQEYASSVPNVRLPLESDNLAEALFHVVQPAGMDINKMASQAVQSLLHPPVAMGAASAKDIVVRIPANRFQLMRSVLASSLPSGQWVEVDLKKFPTPKSALSWALGTQQLALVQATVKGPKAGSKTNGALVRNITQGALRWMTLHEVAVLSTMVDIEPRAILVAEQIVPLEAAVRVPGPALSAVATGSISAALFAEAILHAHAFGVSLPTPAHPIRPTWRCRAAYGAWVTSLARARMTQAASSLSMFGIQVIGVNTSSILVACPRRQLADLRKVLREMPLLSYPVGLRLLEETATVSRSEGHEAIGAIGATL